MLTHPITVLPGVGKAKAKLAAKLNLETIADVLHSYPRTYKDFTKVISPDQAEIGSEGLFTAG